MRHHWSFDPNVTQLNHGSFGAVPNAVRRVQREWQAIFDANPTGFVDDRYQDELDRARTVLAAFVGAAPSGLVFVPNTTAGVASVVGSLGLERDDEIVITDHTYNAVRNIVDVATSLAGGRMVTASIRFPDASENQTVEAVLAAVTERTRLVIIDHITSPTALVLPVERIVQALEPDVPVLVDGAHAPGMVPLAVDRLRTSFYTGNLHKWVCAPPGAAFLVAGDRYRHTVRPPVVSHGWNTPDGTRSLFHRLFDWTGTFDPSAWLSVPAAIEFMASLHPDGWAGVMKANRRLALDARRLLCDRLRVDVPAPEEMIGSMAALPVGSRPGTAERLRQEGIVVPFPPWPTPDTHLVRISAQLYNTLDDYRRLASALD
ncbi:MAG: aminotransferase class V-fold PLP-dependent enzyme [Acidimicrobiia bacterium]